MTMKLRTSLILFIIAPFYLTIVLASEGRKCNPNDLISTMCRENERCVANTHPANSGICDCKEGYLRNRNNTSECVPKPMPTVPSPASTVPTLSPEHAELVHHSSVSAGAITAAVLVPLMLAIGGLLVLIGRRYHWFERLQLLQGRHYEEVRIGQEDDEDDDPPLA
ncbi:Uncharacterized protein GBIM_14840 [Gryllus bimaculatus]|nr:Uncharacterized protein GBIM_14840 [Gryllus bimaculatus]